MTAIDTDERMFSIPASVLLRLMLIDAAAMNLFSIVSDLQGEGDQAPLVEINTGDEYSAALVHTAFAELRKSLAHTA